jgi:hypothetical protein
MHTQSKSSVSCTRPAWKQRLLPCAMPCNACAVCGCVAVAVALRRVAAKRNCIANEWYTGNADACALQLLARELSFLCSASSGISSTQWNPLRGAEAVPACQCAFCLLNVPPSKQPKAHANASLGCRHRWLISGLSNWMFLPFRCVCTWTQNAWLIVVPTPCR